MNIKSILTSVVDAFKNVKGVEAIVLGGSRATNTENEFSDIDIGIYYNDKFELTTFKQIAAAVDDDHREDCITNLGDWGPWINGGGWLTIDNIKVDILFRDTKKATQCIEDCKKGIITIDYQCGHPFGFINSIYLGEIFYCKILHSNSDIIQQLKNSLKIFPSTYKSASIQKFLWECEFSLMCGKKAIKKDDIVYASGSIFRSAICLIYVLYAANEMYCLNEKGSLDRLIKSDKVVLPINFKETIEKSISTVGNNLSISFDEMHNLYSKICDMVAQ
jgi:hypothetical protein